MYHDLYNTSPIFLGEFTARTQCEARGYAALYRGREDFYPIEELPAFIRPEYPTDHRDPAFAVAFLGAGGPL